IAKVNGVDMTRENSRNLDKLLEGDVGKKLLLTVRHASNNQTEEVELVKDRYPVDEATSELFFPLLEALDERLAKNRQDAGLLELRAELAGQQGDVATQVADYSTAIEILEKQPPNAARPRLARLYQCRGDASVALRRWQAAIDDYNRIIT